MDFGIYDTMAGMSKKEITVASVALSVLIGLFGFLFHISASLADLNQKVGMNTAAISANTISIADMREEFRQDVGDLRKDVGDLRKDMGDMREDLGEIRGLLTNHISGHNHASITTDSAEGLE